MIERAQMRHFQQAREIALRAHRRSAEARVQVDQQRADLALAHLMASRDSLVLLHRPAPESPANGVLIGRVEPIWYSGAKQGFVLLAYCEQPFRLIGMVRRFAAWALEERGAARVVLDASFGGRAGEITDRLYRRAGFHLVGGAYSIGGKQP